MTREQVENYRSKKAEIAELHNMLLHIGDGDNMFGNDTILDYRKGYPVPQAVVGVDWDKVIKTEDRYLKMISELKAECQGIEEFIENISDSLTRRIFRMRYIEGLSLKSIGRSVHMDRSSVGKKINSFFENEKLYKKV